MLSRKVIIFVLGLLILNVNTASAQTAPSDYEAGSYKVRVTFDRTPLKSSQEFYITLERLDDATSDWQVRVEVVPAGRTSATPVKFEDNFATTEPAKKLVKLQMPISGQWIIRFYITGNAGDAQFETAAVKVEPPPIIPTTLAWLIGLSPIVGLIGFGFGQWRMIRRRQQAEQAALLSAMKG